MAHLDDCALLLRLSALHHNGTYKTREKCMCTSFSSIHYITLHIEKCHPKFLLHEWSPTIFGSERHSIAQSWHHHWIHIYTTLMSTCSVVQKYTRLATAGYTPHATTASLCVLLSARHTQIERSRESERNRREKKRHNHLSFGFGDAERLRYVETNRIKPPY